MFYCVDKLLFEEIRAPMESIQHFEPWKQENIKILLYFRNSPMGHINNLN